jgi:hypothetical protein
MPRFTFRYHEQDYGIIGFDAPSLEEAQKLFDSIQSQEIEYDELPNYSRRTKGGDVETTDLTQLEEQLPTIPMLLKTGE